MINLYGKPTKAKDGIVYKSEFEANFVNKFLYNSGLEYIYEKKYSDESKHKCDFYLPLYNIWIECVYHEVKIIYAYQKEPLHRIALNDRGDGRTYDVRELIRKMGGRWDASRKQWFITYSGKSLQSLHRFMSKNDLKLEFISDGKAAFPEYDEKLKLKLFGNKSDIMVVTNSDLSYNDLAHLIAVKNNMNIIGKILKVALSSGK